MNITQFRTPGQYLAALLESRGWTQRILSIILDVEEYKLNKIIHNKIAVDAPMALKLGDVFEVDPDDFLIIQKDYDLAKAKIERQPDYNLANRACLFGKLPVSAMSKRGWIHVDNMRDGQRIESALMKFFNVSSTEEIEILPHAPRKTDTFAPVNEVQLAWLYRAKQIAEDLLVSPYSEDNNGSLIHTLSNLLSSSEAIRKIPRIMAENGIRFLVIEALPSSKIDGACFWLDESSPVIVVTLRFDRIDNFWFVLRHELEHVIRKHGQKKIMLDSDLEAIPRCELIEDENIATKAALEFCVPQNRLKSFIERKNPYFKEVDILGFAKLLNIHPGLVIGQLQYKTQRYDIFRKYLVKIRRILTQNAFCDGWGEVYPLDIK